MSILAGPMAPMNADAVAAFGFAAAIGEPFGDGIGDGFDNFRRNYLDSGVSEAAC